MDESVGMGMVDLERLKRRRLLMLLVLGGLCILLLPFVGPSLKRVVVGLRFPYELDSEEGFVLWQAWQLRQGHGIFPSLTAPPYVVATYGPLYPLVNAAFLWGSAPALFGGRLIAALSVAAICLFMFLIIWNETRQALAALLGPLLFLNSYDVYQWLPLYRVDFPALALGLAGLWLLARDGAAVAWRFRTACACFVAMVYTRQVELAPLAAAWCCFALTDRVRAWRLFRNVAGWGLGIALVLTAATRGQFLVHNVYYNANVVQWKDYWWQLHRLLTVHFYLFNRFVALAAVVCLVWFFLERSRRMARLEGNEHAEPGGPAPWGRLGLFAAYAIAASFGILGLGKAGAATNYLIEPKAAWSLFLALVLGKAVGSSGAADGAPGRRPVFFPVALVLTLHAVEFLASSTVVPALGYWIARNPRGRVRQIAESPFVLNYLRSRPQVLFSRDTENPSAVDLRNAGRVVETFRRTPGEVLSERALLALQAGKSVYFQPFIMKELALERKWDQTPVVDALRAKRFAVICTTEDVSKEGFFFHYTDEMVAAMRAAYRLRETLDGTTDTAAIVNYYLFEPREDEAGSGRSEGNKGT